MTDAENTETICQRCGGPNVVWFAPNNVWNRVMPDDGGILCPVCFIQLAESRGLRPTGWRVTPEEPRKDELTTFATDINGDTGLPKPWFA